MTGPTTSGELFALWEANCAQQMGTDRQFPSVLHPAEGALRVSGHCVRMSCDILHVFGCGWGVTAGVQGQRPVQLAVLVEYSDLEVVEQHEDAPACVAPAQADVVQPAVVAQRSRNPWRNRTMFAASCYSARRYRTGWSRPRSTNSSLSTWAR
jgi:hypothetical protein